MYNTDEPLKGCIAYWQVGKQYDNGVVSINICFRKSFVTEWHVMNMLPIKWSVSGLYKNNNDLDHLNAKLKKAIVSLQLQSNCIIFYY